MEKEEGNLVVFDHVTNKKCGKCNEFLLTSDKKIPVQDETGKVIVKMGLFYCKNCKSTIPIAPKDGNIYFHLPCFEQLSMIRIDGYTYKDIDEDKSLIDGCIEAFIIQFNNMKKMRRYEMIKEVEEKAGPKMWIIEEHEFSPSNEQRSQLKKMILEGLEEYRNGYKSKTNKKKEE